MGKKEKDLSIETLRGFAIIFMVAGHVIGSNASGMKVAEDSGWRYFYFTFEYLRMPLFTVISGYVYSLWPAGNSSLIEFYKGKSRRILLPLLSVGTLHFFIQYIIPGTNTKMPLYDLWRIYIFPYEHFWFLQSIFLIFLLIGLLDHLKLFSSVKNWFIIFVTAVLLRNFVPEFEFNLFSINGFFNLLPFFILGCGIKRFGSLFSDKRLIIPIVIVFMTSIAVQQYFWFSTATMNDYEYKLLSLLVAASGITFFFYIRKNIPFISKIGYYAFGIYLYHVFGTAGSRIILMHFGVSRHIILFIAGLVFGLGIPIVIELFLEKSKVLRRIFLGLR
jgi:Acyltransferase family